STGGSGNSTECPEEPVRRVVPGGQVGTATARRRGQLDPEPIVAGQPGQRTAKSLRVAGVEETTLDAVGHEVGEIAGSPTDDRKASGERLGVDGAECLRAARQGEHV